MAIMKNIVAGKYSGNAGAFRFAHKDGQNVVTERVYTNKSKGDGATIEQRTQRCKITNVVNFFKALAPVQRKAWENKPRNLSDYNMFVKKNMARNPYLLAKDLVEAGFFIPFDAQISQGSLPSPFIVSDGYSISCNFIAPEGTTLENLTVKQFCDIIVSSNDSLQYGDQLTFVIVRPSEVIDPALVPNIMPVVLIAEITLKNDADSRLFSDAYDIIYGFTSYAGITITFGGTDNIAGIVSRQSHGKLKCSTASFIETESRAAEYAEGCGTPEFEQAARESYGVQDSVLLTPNL